MSSKQWWVYSDDEPQGPYTTEQLLELDWVTLETRVCPVKSADIRPLQEFSELRTMVGAPQESADQSEAAMEASVGSTTDFFKTEPVTDEAAFAGSSRLSIFVSLSRAWEIFKQHFFFLLGITALYALLALGLSYLGEQIFLTGGPVVMLIWYIAYSLFFLFIQLGYIKIYLQLLDRQPTATSELFSQADKLWAYLAATILFGVVSIVGLIFFVVPGIYLMVRLFFYDFLIVDQRLGAVESLQESWKITVGFNRQLAALAAILVVYLINFFGIMMLGIGLIITLPLTALALVDFYRRLVELSEPPGESAPDNQEIWFD